MSEEPYRIEDRLTLSVKLKLSVTPAQKRLMLRTLDAYRDAMNHVSRYVFDQLNKRQ
ncbi:MAG: hypothetical protein QMC95_03455 [Desulfitobacteriaceae bacterium]|nr:hypothetical protein [Desulfitobacteriaceae bacterium]MDI6878364.1 hypothetical protein [Desulfitobacteriaceae bacterium]MDI6913260.1 hypothetical protein [Desulfitobacteriaceae bacterium]